MLDGLQRFDNFVVGSANRLAASAARAVAESPGSVYSPLFVYGHSGLGKTHLLTAIGHHAEALHPGLVVEYVTLEEFVEQLHLAIGTGQAEAFKKRYQGIGLLLLDDVQFLSGRPETQSEVLRVFNALQSVGRQIVMASDRAPGDIADVDHRLLNRLSGGLTVDVGAPDYETRVAILRHKCAEHQAKLAPGVLEELARSSIANVRELQGALTRLIAHQSLLGECVGVGDVWQILGAVRLASKANEFETFLQDIASGVAASVDAWREHLEVRIAYWSGQGFRTSILEQALDLAEAPDVDHLESSFAAVAERLRALETDAIRLVPAYAGNPMFRDPDRLPEAEALVRAEALRADPLPGPQAGLDLSTMVRVPENRLALRAAGTVIESPGSQYNPLFIFGPPGSGKTHLAHAIGNGLVAGDSGSGPVACLSGDAFMNELIGALQRGTMERWRAKYRAAGALIIDGVQALDGKERTQEELFHLFNALEQAHCAVVLTSDRPLSGFAALADRLRTRFESGLVVELVAPTVQQRTGRFTPVPYGDEAAAPNIDVPPGLVYEPDEPAAHRSALSSETLSAVNSRALDSFFFDSEKILASWADPAGRMVEELT